MIPEVNDCAAADGSNGTLSFGYSEYIAGDSYLLVMSDLDVSSDYTLDFTAGVATQYNFTTGASEESRTYRVVLESPTSGSVATITLEAQSTGTEIDRIVTQSADLEEIINRDTIVDLVMILIVIAVVVGIFITIMKKMN